MEEQAAEPLRALTAVVDRLVADGVGGDGAVDGEVLVALAAQIGRLELVAARGAVGFDASSRWRDDGGQSSPVWLAHGAHEPMRLPRRRLRRGRALEHMPTVEAAWAEGRLGPEHVEVLAGTWRRAIAEVFAHSEAMFVQWAGSLTFAHFVNAMKTWLHAALPDACEDEAAAQREQREFTVSQSYEGVWFGRLTLDPISGEIVNNELRRIESAMFKQEWAEAKERLGRDPSLGELARTPAQRRADALVEMATRSATAPEDGRRPAPLFVAHVNHERFRDRIVELASRTVVTAGSLLAHLDAAYIQRVVFAGDGTVTEVGPRTRFFRGKLRDAIRARDLECAHELCDVPGRECQVDHIQPYSEGGDTTQENGRLACGFHNRLRNGEAETDAVFDEPDDDGEEDEEAAA